jgi:hypothetical protein
MGFQYYTLIYAYVSQVVFHSGSQSKPIYPSSRSPKHATDNYYIFTVMHQP